MMKAVKKLKLWSKKKTKKKQSPPPPPPPPQTCHGCCCCCSTSLMNRPSAPPLPPWFETEQIHETASEVPFPSASTQAADQFPSQSQERASEISPLIEPAIPLGYSPYQQYMTPNPVYGVPVEMPEVGPEKADNDNEIGSRLIRWLCPCFLIRDVRSSRW